MVYVLLADGFEEIEALSPVDLLRRAGVTVQTVGVDTLTPRGARGVAVTADIALKDLSADAEIVVLPGGFPGYENLAKNQTLCEYLKAFRGIIAAICGAPSVLGGLGLLAGKRATCYPGMEDKLGGAIHTADAVCRDGDIITSRSAGTALAFSLTLVKALCGTEVAAQTAKAIDSDIDVRLLP